MVRGSNLDDTFGYRLSLSDDRGALLAEKNLVHTPKQAQQKYLLNVESYHDCSHVNKKHLCLVWIDSDESTFVIRI